MERLVLQSISCPTVIMVFSSWLNERIYSLLSPLWVQWQFLLVVLKLVAKFHVVFQIETIWIMANPLNCIKTREEYLGTCETTMMELLYENNYRLLSVTFFNRKTPSYMFNRVPHTPMDKKVPCFLHRDHL